MNIRDATINDSEIILDIMEYYFKNTAVHFSYSTEPIGEFRNTMARIMERYPFLVLEDNGNVKGFAYAKPFSEVPAYDWSCELTIYIQPDSKRKGFGRQLYKTLEEKLMKMRIKNLYAYIAYTEREDEHLDNSSMKFHEKMGFKKIARFSSCGYKFNKWYDVIWMEKIISKHEHNPEKIINYIHFK